jgi:hypothetical protein
MGSPASSPISARRARRRADPVQAATARPHFSQLKIVGQMDQIGAKAGLGPTDPIVDAQ